MIADSCLVCENLYCAKDANVIIRWRHYTNIDEMTYVPRSTKVVYDVYICKVNDDVISFSVDQEWWETRATYCDNFKMNADEQTWLESESPS